MRRCGQRPPAAKFEGVPQHPLAKEPFNAQNSGHRRLARRLAVFRAGLRRLWDGLDGAAAPQDASSQQVFEFIQSHPLNSVAWLGIALESLGLVLLIVFAARLAGRLRMGDQDWASGAVLALAVTTVATKFASFSPAFVAQLHPDRYGAAVVSGLVDANSLAYNGTLGLDAAFVGVTGLAIG